MFRKSPDDDYDALSEGGVRHLFRLGPYEFHDTLDDEGRFHHFVLEGEHEGAEATAYEVDTEVMYELMARFLAGEYEKAEYRLERSPGHEALLDLLEIATARARAGDHDFSLEDLEEDDDGDFDGEEMEEIEEERGEDSRA